MKKSIGLLLLTSLVFAGLLSFTSTGYKIGDNVSDFTLKNVDGKMISLSSYKDSKGIIVIFTCNHCPYAKAYEKRILDLQKTYSSKGFPVVAINSNDAVKAPADSYDKMVSYSKEKGFTFPYLHDADQSVAKAFGAMRTPHVFLLKRNDKSFEVAYIGAIDDNTEDAGAVTKKYVEDALMAIAKGEKPAITETKAIGCTIKWKS